MKKIVCILLAFFFCINLSDAQQYKKVRVTLKEGMVLKGTNGILSQESVSFFSGKTQQTFPFSKVLTIEGKNGSAGKWALYSGGGCLAIAVIAGVATGKSGIEETGATVGQYAAGCVLWTGIFAGIGAIIGTLTDPYRNVYISRSSSMLKNVNLNLSTAQITKFNTAKCNFTLAYKF